LKRLDGARTDHNNLKVHQDIMSILPPPDRDQAFSFVTLLRGLFGMLVLIAIAWVFSTNRKAISWKVVGIGLGIQLVLAFSILQIPLVQDFFELIGKIFVLILDFTRAGTDFLFAGFLDTSTYGYIFAFQVLPTIIFFRPSPAFCFTWV
jgi:concentrative nucleoside transporter, CNT family